MEQPKWIAKSLTIWGMVVTAASSVVPVVGQFFGVDISAPEIVGFGEQVSALLNALGGVVGTIMIFYGRLRASGPASIKPV